LQLHLGKNTPAGGTRKPCSKLPLQAKTQRRMPRKSPICLILSRRLDTPAQSVFAASQRRAMLHPHRFKVA